MSKKEFNVNGSSYNGKASLNNVIGSWWNHKILQATSQISLYQEVLKNKL